MADAKQVPFLLADIEAFTQRSRESQRATMQALQKIARDAARFFQPFGDPWRLHGRFGTGDGYYFVFETLPPSVALKFADNLLGLADAHNAEFGEDLPLRMRLVLAIGDVELIEDQAFAPAFGDAERVISHGPFKEYLAGHDRSCVIAMSPLFFVAWRQDPDQSRPELLVNPPAINPFHLTDKHDKEHRAYVLGPPLEAPRVAADGADGESTLATLDHRLKSKARHDIARVMSGAVSLIEDQPFVGREAPLEGLLASLDNKNARTRPVWVHAPAGTGKTAFLRQFVRTVVDRITDDLDPPIRLFHRYCWNITSAEGLQEEVVRGLAKLYDVADPPMEMADLARAIEGWPGKHVWVLDDLTYIKGYEDFASRHDAERAAATVAINLLNCAREAGLDVLVVASSRRPAEAGVDLVRLEPLSGPQARDLARQILNKPEMPDDDPEIREGADVLFRWAGQNTGIYRRSLMISRKTGFERFARALRGGKPNPVTAVEIDDAAKAQVRQQFEALDGDSVEDGFDYGAFLRLVYPLVKKAGTFRASEIVTWFGAILSPQESDRRPDDGITLGLWRLADLGVLTRFGDDDPSFGLSPNLRESLRAYAAAEPELPEAVPVRDHESRFSLIREQLERGALEVGRELADLEALIVELSNAGLMDLRDSALFAKVLVSKSYALWRSSLSDDAIRVCDDVIERFGDRDEVDILRSLAGALFNKGAILGELRQWEKAIAAFEEVDRRFGDRAEAAFAERVAMALYNKGVGLGALDRTEEEIAVYEEVDRRYGDREEVALAEQVAKALNNKGVCLGEIDRTEKAIAVYEEVVRRYGDREEAALAEQVASALYNKGVRLRALGLTDKAIAAYEEVDRRHGDRAEAAFAERVAMALNNKGVCLGKIDQTEKAIAAFEEVDRRYGDRAEAAFAEQVAKALYNKGVRLGALGRTEEAITTYEEVDRRYGDRAEAALVVQCAWAAIAKARTLSRRDPAEGRRLFRAFVERFEGREDPKIIEFVEEARRRLAENGE